MSCKVSSASEIQSQHGEIKYDQIIEMYIILQGTHLNIIALGMRHILEHYHKIPLMVNISTVIYRHDGFTTTLLHHIFSKL